MIVFIIALLPFTASERVEIINEGGERMVRLIGAVTFERSDLKITCDRATIFGEDLAILKGNVVLKESTTTITADSLRYEIKTGDGMFYHSSLSESSLVITACSLSYDPNSRRIHGLDSVDIHDSINDLRLSADRFVYNLDSGIGESSGNPKLKILRQDDEPIVTESKIIQYFRNQDELNFIDSVRIKDKNMIIVCDSLNFNNQTSSGELYNLTIKSEDENIKGDVGKFKVIKKEIKSMIISNASVKRDIEDREDQLWCEELFVIFESGSITRAEATGSPRGKTAWK